MTCVTRWMMVMFLMVAALPLQAAKGPASQKITVSKVSKKTYGDAPFTVTASSNSGLPVVLSVFGPAVLAGNRVSLTGAGKVVITATQSGNASYKAASEKINVEVKEATLFAIADSLSRQQGYANPELTVDYTGFVGDDDESVLDKAPEASTKATSSSKVGSYPIKLSSGKDKNYKIQTAPGVLTVEPYFGEPTSGSITLGGSITLTGTGSVVLNGTTTYTGSGVLTGPGGINPGAITLMSTVTLGAAPYVEYGPGTYRINGTTLLTVGSTGKLLAGVGYVVTPVLGGL